MAVTWNPSDKGSNVVLSNGNLTMYTPQGFSNGNVRANTNITSGKKYWEIKYNSGNYPAIGIANINAPLNGTGAFSGNVARLYYLDGKLYPGSITYGAEFTVGDVISIALNMDTGVVRFYKNGVSQDDAFTDIKDTLGDTIYPYVSFAGTDPCTITANFGATPFAYPIPDGYTALDGGTPPAIDVSINSIIASATNQAIMPVITVESIVSVNINGVVAILTSEAIIPTVSANSSLNVNINGVLATSSSEMRIPIISAQIVLSAIIEALRLDSTSKFIAPLISAIRNEIAKLNLSEKVRKQIIKNQDRDISNSEQIRYIRTEVI
ncbi:MAG: SPRY domain-containing protein [Clostridia bacterium]|nr:SPRY domain-containing protein [Clostridia bacterium]